MTTDNKSTEELQRLGMFETDEGTALVADIRGIQRGTYDMILEVNSPHYFTVVTNLRQYSSRFAELKDRDDEYTRLRNAWMACREEEAEE